MHAKQRALSFALTAGLLQHTLAAQTILVNTATDLIDVPTATATVADLPGPDGLISFSEALIAANHTPGAQRIEFNIPGTGFPLLSSIVGFYWSATDPVVIDGWSQAAFAGVLDPNKAPIQLWSAPLRINAAGCEVSGFHGSSLNVNAGPSLVERNTGSSIEVFGSGGSTIRGNTGNTIKIDRSNDNVVVGNQVLRVRVLGGGSSQLASGNRVGGPALEDRNKILGYGTYGPQGFPSGTTVQLVWTSDTRIENNWIGLSADGLSQGSTISVTGIGVETENYGLTVVGNRIAGILGKGIFPSAGLLSGAAIRIGGAGSGIEFSGNRIGLDANDQPTLGSLFGIDASSTFGKLQVRFLGGNRVAGQRLGGATISGTISSVDLGDTLFYDNDGLGIDLKPATGASGVTPNDPLDADLGGNGLQNFPDLVAAQSVPGGVRVLGQLESSANDAFTLRFFGSPALDPTGFGEGATYLGSAGVFTDGSGRASFDQLLPSAVPANWFVTATATLDSAGRTSEFSAGAPLDGVVCQLDLGFGGPGASQLSLCGEALATGNQSVLQLSGAMPGSPVFLGLSTGFQPTPLFGGTLVPVPTTVFEAGFTDGAGGYTRTVPGGNGPFTLYVQAATLDLSLPQLVSLSNALAASYLP